MWLVNGIGYHWALFAGINPVARVFGAVFVLQAVLPAATGSSRRIAAARDTRSCAGLALAADWLVLYPAIGWLAGHFWRAASVSGIAPCPTTIFTTGVALLGTWPTARWLLMILWGIVGGGPCASRSWPVGPRFPARGLVGLGPVQGGAQYLRWSSRT